MGMHRCRLVELAILASACVLAPASSLRAEDIQVPPDQVRLVTLNAPAKTVFIGNPSIADVTVIDPTHVFVMGKNLGRTNIIALDTAGHEFVNEQVLVLDLAGTMVTVQHGQGQMTLSCSADRCASIVTPGDEKKPTERTDSLTIGDQFKAREEIATKSAGNGTTGSSGSSGSGGTGAQQ
jgi:Flp pilus assembly secretin CpaC